MILSCLLLHGTEYIICGCTRRPSGATAPSIALSVKGLVRLGPGQPCSAQQEMAIVAGAVEIRNWLLLLLIM